MSMIGTHPSICVATLTCVVWELLEGAHHGTCVASLCECSLQQQLITGVRVGPAGSAVELRWSMSLRQRSSRGTESLLVLRYMSGARLVICV